MTPHHQARNLYFQTEMKQADIASIVGISDRTLSRWIAQHNWKQMKETAKQAPIAIVEMLYKQLHALNSSICEREVPIPTLEEAEINRKLINSISKLKQQASVSENIQVLMGFTGFLNKQDNELGKQVVTYADQYLKDKIGYAPLGFYDDAEEEDEPNEELTADTDPIIAAPPAAIKKKVTRITKAAVKKELSQAQPQKAAAQKETLVELKKELTFLEQMEEEDRQFPSQMQEEAQSLFPVGSPERDPTAQQKAINTFYDEMRRFADTQFKNRNSW